MKIDRKTFLVTSEGGSYTFTTQKLSAIPREKVLVNRKSSSDALTDLDTLHQDFEPQQK